jgi:hypothetical protein
VAHVGGELFRETGNEEGFPEFRRLASIVKFHSLPGTVHLPDEEKEFIAFAGFHAEEQLPAGGNGLIEVPEPDILLREVDDDLLLDRGALSSRRSRGGVIAFL